MVEDVEEEDVEEEVRDLCSRFFRCSFVCQLLSFWIPYFVVYLYDYLHRSFAVPSVRLRNVSLGH